MSRAHTFATGLSLCVASAALVLTGCAGPPTPASTDSGPSVQINVAPLDLAGVTNVCYAVEVRNEAGEAVWSKAHLCSDQYGDSGGALAYVGSCDATDSAGGDGIANNTVTLAVENLYDTAHPWTGDPEAPGATAWQNPCVDDPATTDAIEGCTRQVACRADRDTPVDFDLTIARAAQQGFFDVAIGFDDIFCSAKVDCSYTSGDPIKLVFDPATGERVQTVVWAFACTDGDPGGSTETATHLYMDDVVLDCDGTTYAVDPTAGPGNVYPNGAGAPLPLVQAQVFRGEEQLQNNGQDADKRYWNVALGLDMGFFSPTTGTAPDCVLQTRATASKGPLLYGTTAEGATYPYVQVAVPINTGNAITCTQHPVDGTGAHAGVSTHYTGTTGGSDTVAFGKVLDSSGEAGDVQGPLAPNGAPCVMGNECVSSTCSIDSETCVDPEEITLTGGDRGGTDWTLEDGEVVSGVHTGIGVLTIPAGVTVTVAPYDGYLRGVFVVDAEEVVIEGTLDASGAGYPAQQGPGKGGNDGDSPCGGGYGGAGGVGDAYNPQYECTPGPAYGLAALESVPWSANDVAMGSGGGGSGSRAGGAGGGKVVFSAPTVTISGTIRADGGQGQTDGCQNGAGGSGGGILLLGDTVSVSGVMTATGGADGTGFCDPAGGGGGGRIKIEAANLDVDAATVDVTGGSGYRSGQSGTYYHAESTPPTSTITGPTEGQPYRTAPTIHGTTSDDTSVDVVEIRLVRDDDGAFWGGSGWVVGEAWVAGSGRTTWTLNDAPTAGDYTDGGYTLTSRATDVASNVELAPPTLHFVWDTTPPIGTALAIDEAPVTAETTIHLTIGIGDAVDMRVSGDIIDGANTFAWIPAATSLAVEMPPTLGTHSVTVSFRDEAGNVGGDQSATVEYDVPWTSLSGGDHEGGDWTLSDGDVIAGVHENVGVFTIPAGVTVTVEAYDGSGFGELIVNAAEVHVLGTLDGTAAGYPAQSGPGAGGNDGDSPCGGGYGGMGGVGDAYNPQYECTPGPAYGLSSLETDPWSDDDVAMGSGGGGSGSRAGGSGGAKIVLSAAIVEVPGTVRADGGQGRTDGCQNGAGGSGGGVLLLGDSVAVTGTLSATGGDDGTGFCDPAGGGGGGRIKVYGASVDVDTASVDVAGGSGYQAGVDGTFYHPETTPPVSTITTPTDGQTFRTAPSFQGTASDNTSVGLVDVRLVRSDDGFSWDGTDWVAAETWLEADGRTSWGLTDAPTASDYTDGSYGVTSRATDATGNVETALTTIGFVWDTTPPVGTSLTIDEAPTTAVTTVHLSIGIGDAADMRVTGDIIDSANTFEWIPAATTLVVDLPPILGTHSVTVSFRDAAGNVGGDQTATVDLDVPWTTLSGGDHGGSDWTLSDGDVIAGVHDNVGVLTIPAGATVTVQPYDGSDFGDLVVNAAEVHVLGTLDGTGAGYLAQTGPGAGGNDGDSPCGGGYGGAGGVGDAYNPQYECTPGPAYGLAARETNPWSDDDIAMGSGGGGSGSRAGGSGGAKIVMSAATVEVTGTIIANGGQGSTDGCQNGAGGSGGGILLLGDDVAVTGTLSATGGDDGTGFCDPAGGGGGGRVKVFGTTTIDVSSATVDVTGGSGYRSGIAGTWYYPEATPPTSTISSPSDGQTFRAAPTFQGATSDDTSVDVVEVRLVRDADGFSWDGTDWIAAETWLAAEGRTSWTFASAPTTADYTDGGHTVTSRATDVAGNVEVGPLSTIGFTWDATPPTGTVTIDEGGVTAETKINLTIDYGDAVEMRVIGDLYDDANTFEWIAAASALEVELTPVIGVHTVTVTFRDAIGNEGGAVSATIDYQTVWTETAGGDHSGADWTVNDGDVIAGLHENVGIFTVPAGVTVTIAAYDGTDFGSVIINADEVHVLGTIDGTGAGYAPQSGTGAGTNGGETPCGGGYGGVGGQGKDLGASSCIPGATYGLAAIETVPWSANDVAFGSGGGSLSASALGGRGGGKVVLSAPVVEVTGAVLVDGGSVSGSCDVGGGGSGGGVLLLGDDITVSGELSAEGGASDSTTCYAGGGGGGGRIKIRSTTLDTTGSIISVAGGAGYGLGEDGTYFHPETNPPTTTITSPTGVAVSSPPSFTGTATDDTTVATVEVNLVRDSDGFSWDGGAWVAGVTWLPADGRASWSFSDGPAAGSYANGTYTVWSRATDVAGNTETSPPSVQYEWTGGP